MINLFVMTMGTENKISGKDAAAMNALFTATRLLAEGNHAGALASVRSVTGGVYYTEALMQEALILALQGAPAAETEAALKKAAKAGDKTAAFYLAYACSDSSEADLAKAAEATEKWHFVRHGALFNHAPMITPPTGDEKERMLQAAAEHIVQIEQLEVAAERARLAEEAKATADKASLDAEAQAAAEKKRREAEEKAAALAARRKADEKAIKAAKNAGKPNIPFLVLMWASYAILEVLLFCQIYSVEVSMAFNRYTAMALLALTVIPILYQIEDISYLRHTSDKALTSTGLGKFSLALCVSLLFVIHLQVYHLTFEGEPLNTFLILFNFTFLYALLFFGYGLCMISCMARNSHRKTCASLILSSIVCCAIYMGILSLFGTPWNAFTQVLNLLFS